MSMRKSPSIDATTNSEGIVQVQYTCGAEEVLSIDVTPRTPKEQCGDTVSLTLEEIARGLVADPNSAGGIGCPTKIRKKLKPVPWTVIMFVKKPTWYQSHIAG